MTAKILGAILVVLGIAVLVYGGFNYTETHKADVGPLELKVKEKERVDIPWWAGAALTVGGVAVMLFGRKVSIRVGP